MDEGIKQLLIVAIAVIVGVALIGFINANNSGFIAQIGAGITQAIAKITGSLPA